jgi:hypothetical protein
MRTRECVRAAVVRAVKEGRRAVKSGIGLYEHFVESRVGV